MHTSVSIAFFIIIINLHLMQSKIIFIQYYCIPDLITEIRIEKKYLIR